MNITKLTLDNSRIAIIALSIIAIMGVKNYFDLSQDSMPPYTIRMASVVTRFPGASPLRVEELVTDALEESIREVVEVKSIESESRSGLSVITVELKNEVAKDQLRAVWDELRQKMSDIKPFLPQGTMGPIVKDKDIGTVFGVILGVTSDGVEEKIIENYAKDIRSELLQLRDVAKVKYGGVQEQRVFIEFDDQQLSRYGLTSQQVKNIIGSTNILFSGGELTIGRRRILLEPTGNYESIDDIKKTLIPTPTGESVLLGDITTIYSDYIVPSEKKVKVNNEEAIALYVSLKQGANIVSLGKDVSQLIPEINKKLPLGIELVRVASQDQIVEKQVSDFLVSLAQSIIIVLAVMLFFLGFRTGSLVAALIPMVVVFSFFSMYMLGIGLNKVSLAALIISLGLMVDSGIVLAESILIRTEEGQSVRDAAIASCKILMVPLLISTLTTSSAFLSFALAQTPMGEMASPLFYVVTIALLSSWILAFTFIPLLALVLVKTQQKTKKEEKKGKIDHAMERLNLWYNKVLVKVLKKPIVFSGVILTLFILSVVSISFLPFKLVPDSDRNLVTVDVKLPSGTQIELTEKALEVIEKYIKDSLMIRHTRRGRGVLDFSSYIGEGPEAYDLGYMKDEANSNYAHVLLNTTGDLDNEFVISKLDRFCFLNIPEADIRVNRLSGAGAAGTPVEIRISGADTEELAKLASTLKQQMYSVPGTKNITDDWGPKTKKVVVQIDESKAKRVGLSNRDIANALYTGLSGYTVGSFREGSKSIPIILKDQQDEIRSIESIAQLNIFSAQRKLNVSLGQLANVMIDWQFSKIKRKDLNRTVTVGCYLKPGYTANDIFTAIEPWLVEQQQDWKSGYQYVFGGEDEDTNENLGAIFQWLPISFFLIMFLLVLQFNSMRKAAIIITTIPLGIIGVVIGWYVGNSFVSFFGILGVIALAGILINDSIVLLDRIDVEAEADPRASKQVAILRAANHKFRPVILTTLTTSLGMIPLLISGGLLWEPLALAIIFGLFFATVIILLFVPVLYRLLFKVNFNDYVFDHADLHGSH